MKKSDTTQSQHATDSPDSTECEQLQHNIPPAPIPQPLAPSPSEPTEEASTQDPTPETTIPSPFEDVSNASSSSPPPPCADTESESPDKSSPENGRSPKSKNGWSFKKAKEGAYFWGSLFATTAVPGYVGRNMGMTAASHWNFITDKVILGALPVKSKVGKAGNHLAKLKRQFEARSLHLGMVVSAVQDEEFNGYGVNVVQFVNHDDWKKEFGVQDVLQVKIADNGANIALTEMETITNKIYTVVHGRQQAVYVHCKAGRGRSWLIVCCYLITHEGHTFESALAHIKSKRQNVFPNNIQTSYAKRFEEYINSVRGTQYSSATSSPKVDRPRGSWNSSTAPIYINSPNGSMLSQTDRMGTSPVTTDSMDESDVYYQVLVSALELAPAQKMQLLHDIGKSMKLDVHMEPMEPASPSTPVVANTNDEEEAQN